jgi:hypothetical protein
MSDVRCEMSTWVHLICAGPLFEFAGNQQRSPSHASHLMWLTTLARVGGVNVVICQRYSAASAVAEPVQAILMASDFSSACTWQGSRRQSLMARPAPRLPLSQRQSQQCSQRAQTHATVATVQARLVAALPCLPTGTAFV